MEELDCEPAVTVRAPERGLFYRSVNRLAFLAAAVWDVRLAGSSVWALVVPMLSPAAEALLHPFQPLSF